MVNVTEDSFRDYLTSAPQAYFAPFWEEVRDRSGLFKRITIVNNFINFRNTRDDRQGIDFTTFADRRNLGCKSFLMRGECFLDKFLIS